MTNQYDSNAIYQGSVITQQLSQSRDGDPQLRLGVQLTHKLKTKVLSDGVDALNEADASVKTIYFNFKPDPAILERTFRDLRNLGMTTPNIELLDPAHHKAVLMLEQVVQLKPRYSAGNDGVMKDWWNLYFPLSKAPSMDADALKKFKDNHGSALSDGFLKASVPKTPYQGAKVNF